MADNKSSLVQIAQDILDESSQSIKVSVVAGGGGGGGGDVNLTAIEGVNVSVNTGNADAGTQRVVIATNQPSVAITGTVTANTGLSQPLTDAQLRASSVPVSATSLPLPTGAATEASVQRLNSVNLVRNSYTTTSVTTAAYVQLVASVASSVKEIEIFDSSGESLVLALGASGSESDKVYVFPGGNGRIPLQMSVGQRLSIKAVSANATSGELLINFYG
jgi:hypothetical protein